MSDYLMATGSLPASWGGYAQLSYGFNYYGPTGPQRDEVVLVRRLHGEVRY